MCIYICVCVHTYIYIYIYMYISRARSSGKTPRAGSPGGTKRRQQWGSWCTFEFLDSCVYLCIYIYIYIYMCIYTCKVSQPPIWFQFNYAHHFQTATTTYKIGSVGRDLPRREPRGVGEGAVAEDRAKGRGRSPKLFSKPPRAAGYKLNSIMFYNGAVK